MDVQIVKVTPKLARLGCELVGGRGLLVDIRPNPTGLVLVIWIRDPQDDNHVHVWPGPHVRHDFFTRREEVLLQGGMEEIAECALGDVLDLDMIHTLIDAVKFVMRAVGDDVEADAAA